MMKTVAFFNRWPKVANAMKFTWLFLVIFVAPALRAGRQPVAELDFTRQQCGVVPDRDPTKPAAVIDTYNVYGRLRGKRAVSKHDAAQATIAIGRSGRLGALRLTKGGEPLRLEGHRLRTGEPFSFEIWLWIDEGVQNSGEFRHYDGKLLVVTPDYFKRGLSLRTSSRWAKNGWFGLFTPTSDPITTAEFSPACWHHVVVSYDGEKIALYVDGEKLGEKTARPNFDDIGNRRGGFLRIGVGEVNFKVDGFALYNEPLSPAFVKERYSRGCPDPSSPDSQKKHFTLGLPMDSYGYFPVEQPISVAVTAPTEVDELLVNGIAHSLPLKEPVSLRFPSPGFQEIDLTLASKGEIVVRRRYPLAIVPSLPKSSKVGAAAIGEMRPELSTLGVKFSRVVADWRQLQPTKEDYDWERLDTAIERDHELGLESVLCVTGLPRWAKWPYDKAAYIKLWRLLAGRYGNVKFFEVWNAIGSGNSIDKKQYLEMLRIATETLRASVTGVKILAGRLDDSDGLANSIWLQKEGAAWYDIFSARAYTTSPAKTHEKNAVTAKLVKANSKPVWNTACGVRQFARSSLLPVKDEIQRIEKKWPMWVVDEETAATWLIQDLALQFADGVERVFLDAGPSDYFPVASATEGLPGKQGLALAVFNSLIGENAKLSHQSGLPAGINAIRFENSDGPSGLILFTSGAETTFPVVAGQYALDLYGHPISIVDELEFATRPCYLLDR